MTAHGARRRGVWKWIALAGIGGVLVGVFLGFLAATVMSKRSAYNLAVRDGKAIYETVRDEAAQDDKAFTAYRQDLVELGELMDSTLRTQKSSSPTAGDGLGDYPLSL